MTSLKNTELKMVEVFKTNIEQPKQAATLMAVLSRHFPFSRINVDLEDCDRVLRVEGESVLPEEVIGIVSKNGYKCEVLE